MRVNSLTDRDDPARLRRPVRTDVDPLFAFDRTHTIYVIFQFRVFYDVPRVLIADAR